MPHVVRITIYPMKSCDGLSQNIVQVSPSGALQYDRQFALVDSMGGSINAKRIPLIHRLRLLIDPPRREFRVARRDGGDESCGRLVDDGQQLTDWLSDFFSLDVSFVENDQTGFPDDLNAPGPTVISTATLQTVAGWFTGMTVDEVRLRGRANIEIDGVEPFWEDRLFRGDLQPQPFRIGEVVFGGVNPCQRCVVPTRDSQTGEVTPPSFAQTFGERRERALPTWASREHFNHYYRLSTNTRILDRKNGGIRVGDRVEVLVTD